MKKLLLMSLLFTGFISCDSDDSIPEDKIYIAYSNITHLAINDKNEHVYYLSTGVKNTSTKTVKGKVKFVIKGYGEFNTQVKEIEPSYKYVTVFDLNITLKDKIDKSFLDKVELIIEK